MIDLDLDANIDADLDLAHDLVRDNISDAAMPRSTRVYTGWYPDTLTRKWEVSA